MNVPQPYPAPPARSGLVTAIAWILIAFAGFGILIASLQLMMMSVFLGRENTPMLPAGGPPLPPAAEFMFRNGHWLFVGFFLLSVLGFGSGIGLLRRQNWARLAVIGLLAVGIVWNLGGAGASFFLFRDFMPTEAPPEFSEKFEGMFTTMMVVNLAIAVAFATFFAWLIRRLASPAIRREFQGPPETTRLE